MKSSVKAALVQFSPFPMEEMQKNVAFIIKKIEELALRGNELIVFPEMSITNFFVHGPVGKKKYWDKGTLSINDIAMKHIIQAAKNNQVFVIVGFAERSHTIGNIYNSTVLIGPTGIIGLTRKIHFPGIEKLYFAEGQEAQVFDTPIGKIGICICYDCMFPEYVRLLAVNGAEIIVFPSSIWKGGNKGGIGSIGSKERFWDRLPSIRAMENQCYIIACNGGGNHYMGEENGYWERVGLSKIVSPTGEILDETLGNEECVLEATLNSTILEESRCDYAFLSDRKPYMYEGIAKEFL